MPGILVALFALALLVTGCATRDTGRDDFDLTILHINDHHSHLDPIRASLKLPGGEDAAHGDVTVSMGGFARVATAFEELARGRDNVLKLHAGDAITGTPYFTLTSGRADAAMMNFICFDAMAVGNHEFDAGDAGLRRFADFLWSHPQCRTPLLSTNITPRPDSPLGTTTIQPSLVLERGGQRIGIVGLTAADKTMTSSRPDPGTLVHDETRAAQAAIDTLTAQGIDKIVLLSHVGYSAERILATELSGVDIIVGGDSHTLLGGADLASLGLPVEADYPTMEHNLDGDPVCIVHAWQNSTVVGELRVRFDAHGKVRSCDGQAHVLIDNHFPGRSPTEQMAIRSALANHPSLRVTAESPAALAVLAPYRERQQSFSRAVVATAERDLCLRRVPGPTRDRSRSVLTDCADDPHVVAHGGDMQQLVALAFLRQGQRFGGADLSLTNGGGVRIDLPAGAITIGDLYTALPFDRTLVRLTMTGAELHAVIEDAIEMVENGNTGSYPYSAGLRWQVDMREARGARVNALELRGDDGNWSPLDPARHYRVVTHGYLAEGRDGYDILATIDGARREETFMPDAESMVEYARELRTLTRPATADFSTRAFRDSR